MAITVQALLANAASLLQDTTNVRWTAAQLLVWLNDGQRELVLLKPDAYVKSTATILVAGTKQTIPTDGIYLVDIPRYLGTDGITPTNSVKSISREILDNQVPDWHAARHANVRPKHFIYNELEPKRFYVYPPQPTSGFGYVEVVYTAVPPDAVSPGSLSLADEYAGALLSFILFRAYSQDSEWAGNKELSAMHYGHFVGLLTGKDQAEDETTPNKALGPMGPPGGNK